MGSQIAYCEEDPLEALTSLHRFNPYLVFMKAFLELLDDLYAFMRARQKYWLVPLVLALVLMGALLVFTKGSVVAPFIYSLF